MNSGSPAHKVMNVSGGTFNGSPIGWENKISYNTVTVGDVQASVSVDDVRKAIAVTRENLVGAAEDPDARAVVRYLISTIEGELAKDQPRGSEVRSRWDEVRKMLNPLSAAAGVIAQVTDLITKVFSGS